MYHPSGENFGHGLVFPRKDGNRVRCGGPVLCPTCKSDKRLLDSIEENLADRPPQADLEKTVHRFDTYLHSGKDASWGEIEDLINGGEIPPMSQAAKENYMYQFLEVVLNVELDINTGEVTILGVGGVPLTKPVKR